MGAIRARKDVFVQKKGAWSAAAISSEKSQEAQSTRLPVTANTRTKKSTGNVNVQWTVSATPTAPPSVSKPPTGYSSSTAGSANTPTPKSAADAPANPPTTSPKPSATPPASVNQKSTTPTTTKPTGTVTNVGSIVPVIIQDVLAVLMGLFISIIRRVFVTIGIILTGKIVCVLTRMKCMLIP